MKCVVVPVGCAVPHGKWGYGIGSGGRRRREGEKVGYVLSLYARLSVSFRSGESSVVAIAISIERSDIVCSSCSAPLFFNNAHVIRER
jgi:hypothetical protein